MSNYFGEFASGFAGSFASALTAKKEQERKDKMAKLQGQLVELQMKAMETQQGAQQKVTDMMAGNTLGEFNIQPDQGLGQFNIQSQPGADGRLQAPQFEQAEGMNLPPQQDPGVGEPMGLQQMMQNPEGLSALMASGQLSLSDLIPKSGSPNRTLEMLDRWKQTEDPQERALLENAIGGGADDDIFTKMMLQTQLQLEQDRLAERRRTQQKEEKTEGQRIRGVQVDTSTDIKHTQEMFDLMSRLDGTALAVGNPVGDFLTKGKAGLNSLMEATGWDVAKSQQMVVDRKRLDKLFADGTLGALDRFEGTGTVSGAKFEALREATPNSMVPSQSNMLLLADRLENLLSAADIEGIDIKERGDAERLIEQLRSYRPAGAEATIDGPGAVQDVIDFSNMTMDKLNQIDIEQLTAEQLQALKARIQELRD